MQWCQQSVLVALAYVIEGDGAGNKQNAPLFLLASHQETAAIRYGGCCNTRDLACLVLCMTTYSVAVILPIYPDQHFHLDLKLFNWGLLLCVFLLGFFFTLDTSVSWSFLNALVAQLLKITVVIHISNSSHVLMAGTRKLYDCKLSSKIFCVCVCVSGCTTGLGVLMGVELVFHKIHGKF